MDETLIDIVDTLLGEYMGEEEVGNVNRAESFLSFYNLTYEKKHSREEKVFLTSCCSLVFCKVLPAMELDDELSYRFRQA